MLKSGWYFMKKPDKHSIKIVLVIIYQKAHFSNASSLLQTLPPEVTCLISKYMIGSSSSCLYSPQEKMLSLTEIKKKKLLT